LTAIANHNTNEFDFAFKNNQVSEEIISGQATKSVKVGIDPAKMVRLFEVYSEDYKFISGFKLFDVSNNCLL
jgi:hypothetical protein